MGPVAVIKDKIFDFASLLNTKTLFRQGESLDAYWVLDRCERFAVHLNDAGGVLFPLPIVERSDPDRDFDTRHL